MIRVSLPLPHRWSLGESAILWRQTVPENVQLVRVMEGYLKNLVDQIPMDRTLLQRLPEQFHLNADFHTFGPVEADQARVEHDIGVLPTRPRFGSEPPKECRSRWSPYH